MFKLGNFNVLESVREKEFGVYLSSDVGDILLPRKYVPDGFVLGDKVNVFVYKDSENRYVATTQIPKGVVGEYAYLEVKDTNKIGAFLDWGLEKDLLVPYNEQDKRMTIGKKYVVRICEDTVSNRIIASVKLNKYIENEDGIDLKVADEVNLMACESIDNGLKVIVENKYFGLIYKDETEYSEIKKGDKFKGFVKKIREDNKIDITLRKRVDKEIEDAKKSILKELKKNNGHIDIGDKSSPDEIKAKFKMSKNVFKKAIGGLYKDEIVELSATSITKK